MLDFAKDYIEYNRKMNKLDLEEYYRNNYSNISSTFIISLDKDHERYRETNNLLEGLDIENIIKFPAVYGQSLKNTNKSIFNTFNKLSAGEIGCFLSHFIIYYIASEHVNENCYTLIFEDDVILNSNNIVQKINDAIMYNLDMIYLGKCYECCTNLTTIKDDLYYGYNPVCFHSYLIKNSFAREIVNYIGKQSVIDEPIDNFVARLIRKDRLLVFHPSLFIQNVAWESNLREKDKQQFNNIECSYLRQTKKFIEHFGNKNNDFGGIIVIIIVIGIIYFFVCNDYKHNFII